MNREKNTESGGLLLQSPLTFIHMCLGKVKEYHLVLPNCHVMLKYLKNFGWKSFENNLVNQSNYVGHTNWLSKFFATLL